MSDPSDSNATRAIVDSDDATRAETTASESQRQRAVLLSPGTMVGRYVVLESVGAGGMGVVYAAYDPELNRRIAVKLLHRNAAAGSDTSEGQRRLLREAQAMAKLSHPNVVTVHDVGTHEDSVFVAMEFIEGTTLRKWMAEGTRSWEQITDVFERAARGLEAAHRADLVHRDFKPDNVMIGADGRVRVMDFGLALSGEERSAASSRSWVRSTSSDETITQTGAVIGTPAYMAPEQHAGEPTGPAGDQFSFCVTLFDCLYGSRPFPGNTFEAIRDRTLSGEIQMPAGVHKVPRWMERVLRRGLSRVPKDRYPSMTELLEDIGRYRSRRRLLRRGLTVAAVGLVAVGVAAGVRVWREAQAREAAAAWERTAEDRLGDLQTTMAELRAQGKAQAAQEAFTAFVETHEGTRAVARAWLDRADQARQANTPDRELEDLARAYAAAPDAELQREVIGGLAQTLARNWDWEGLAACLERVPEGEHRDLRAQLELARRNVEGALAVDPDGSIQDVGPVLAALTRGTNTSRLVKGVRAVWGPDGRVSRVITLRKDRRTIDALALAPNLPRQQTWTLPDTWGPAGAVFPMVFGSPARLHLLAWSPKNPKGGPRAVLYRLDGDDPEPLLDWEEYVPGAVAAADTDGDGVREAYVGIGAYSRQLYRIGPDESGRWRRFAPHAHTDGMDSDVSALLPVPAIDEKRDLLAVSLGPWTAYDVRVLAAAREPKAEPDAPELELLARRKMGHVPALARLSGERRIAAAKGTMFPSAIAFPDKAAHGDPPGVYLLDVDDPKLEPSAFIPAPHGATSGPLEPTSMVAGDFDGDGLTDLGVTWKRSGLAGLYRQQPDGSFSVRYLPGLVFRAAANIDDDPADEIVATVDGGSVWVLGAGDELLPRLDSETTVAFEAAPVPDVVGQDLHGPWSRAEDLGSMGLQRAAVAQLERLALVAGDSPAAGLAHARAGEILEGLDDMHGAAASYREATEHGDVRPTTVAAAARSAFAIHAFAQARELVDRLMGGGDVPPEIMAEADDLAAKLGRLGMDAGPTILSFDEPLHGSWRVSSPAHVRHAPTRGLTIEAPLNAGDLAVLPVRATGGRVALRVQATVTRREWASGVVVGLRPVGADSPAVGVETMAWGGGGRFQDQRGCRVNGTLKLGDNQDSAGVGVEVELDAEVDVVADLSQAICRVKGQTPKRGKVDAPWLNDGTPLELVIASAGDTRVQEPLYTKLRIASVTLRGLEVVDSTAPPTQEESMALAFANGGAFSTVEVGRNPEPKIWVALLLEDLGRRKEARRMLQQISRSADPAGRRALWATLRVDDQSYESLFRDALGPEYFMAFEHVWTSPAGAHSRDPWTSRVFLRSLGGLSEVRPDDVEGETNVLIRLHKRRGLFRFHAGRHPAALADFERILELAADDDSREAKRAASLAYRYMAAIAAAAGQRDRALGHARRSMLLAYAPERGYDRLDNHPALRELRGESSWRKLLAD